ncbi:MAG: thioredoxin-dependent thiol peroxidase [Dolichospermum sp. JUN01]|jgi:peroxiredoxin Q/BCP|uniref:thioredoxin-dependent thiol peroxidase n=1 Tax=Dolichospermum circinale TaxID=109265 RepID=UPI001AF1AEC8|nr:thioredoxin-dependent thiol peroxidase [Dolichospermum circinale]MBO1058473.1 thioredoxin-dependent thiol peroxidase [Dolichospermum sp. JUN01]MBS9392812.1 thioredoxin-dependent thiol peroxidase [Dolichospermum sp. OL01]MCO5796447.1 thioredoxin-dependent thiol peroxidase [Dolichospermum sp. OL03]MCS6280434.1 thioredoxin-dependent thiol peroxidase [Dolichospermum sp.]QSV58052.1 MAG: thioredoxin-dependent thiol peroxidase [Dolichospermum sp. LBC05a]
MSNIPQIGQPAPDFSTPDQNNNLVNIADLNQWLVLYFYPKDNTPGCTTEAQDFTELSSEFTTVGAKIIGVSPDSATSHCKFIDKHNLSITLLTDPEHQLIEAYGAWRLKKFMGKEYMGVARSTFLISPNKSIAYAWPNVKTKGHAEAVLKKIKELAAI